MRPPSRVRLAVTDYLRTGGGGQSCRPNGAPHYLPRLLRQPFTPVRTDGRRVHRDDSPQFAALASSYKGLGSEGMIVLWYTITTYSTPNLCDPHHGLFEPASGPLLPGLKRLATPSFTLRSRRRSKTALGHPGCNRPVGTEIPRDCADSAARPARSVNNVRPGRHSAAPRAPEGAAMVWHRPTTAMPQIPCRHDLISESKP